MGFGEGGRRRRRREEDRNDEYTRSQQVAYSVQRRTAALAVQDGGRQARQAVQGRAVELGYSQFSAAIGIGCCRTLASLCSFPSLTEINTEGGPGGRTDVPLLLLLDLITILIIISVWSDSVFCSCKRGTGHLLGTGHHLSRLSQTYVLFSFFLNNDNSGHF